MKYIKLFEAFESQKLSKTLGFLKSGKDRFMEELKSLSKKNNFPLSNFSDDMFQYLPFKKAFEFFWTPEPKTCETCKGEGEYRRPWGKGSRVVKCKECGSTGKVTPSIGKTSHIKFWFNSEGKYVGKTGINGEVFEKDVINISGGKYTIDRRISITELKNLPHESKVQIYLRWRMVPGVIWKSGNDIWFIQSYDSDGRYPRGEQWKKWGERAWKLNDYNQSDSHYFPFLLKEKSETDPYDFNFQIRFDYGSGIVVYKTHDIKDIIKEAEFALILDLNKLVPKEKLSDMRSRRQERKSGILTPEEIKRQNIDRYFDRLSKEMEISQDFGQVSKILPRLFGWSNCIFFIFDGTNISYLGNIIEHYFEFMRSEKSEADIRNFQTGIRSRVGYSLEYVKERYQNISNTISMIRSKLIKNRENEIQIKFIDSLMNLSAEINRKVLSKNTETLDDLEISLQRINSIMDIVTSHRYSLSDFRYFFSKIGRYSSDEMYEYILNKDISQFERAIKDMETIRGLIDRM